MKCTKLIFRSPVFGSVQCEELPNEECRCVDFGPYTAFQLYQKGPDVEMFLTEHCEDLAKCVPEELEALVVRADFGSCDLEAHQMYLITEIYVRRELTEREQSLLREWIVGQMSDGWGEGLEQHPVLSETVYTRLPFFDDDECEFQDEEIRCDAEYFLHPWARDTRWSVVLVGEEAVELDIEEPDTEEEMRQTVIKIKELVDEIVEELKKIT